MSAVNRLYIFCEGQTEETFARLVLDLHFLTAFGTSVYPLVIPNVKGAHSRRYKGGWNKYQTAPHFVRGIMEQHHGDGVWFTTLFDFYALPGDYPKPASAASGTARVQVLALEEAMRLDVTTDKLWRFTPHLQLHEFEALLLSDIDQFADEFPERLEELSHLKAELGGIAPEDVNDGVETHPSRRIIRHIPEYEGRKASAGPILASRIGLDRLRQRCPHFAHWVSELERQFVK